MPYKDPERKKEWERLHRPQRLKRRRELRRIEGAQQGPKSESPKGDVGVSALLVSVIAGGALAAYSPKIGMAVGGVTLVSSAVWKKGWMWWAAGRVAMLIGLLFYYIENERADNSVGSGAQA